MNLEALDKNFAVPGNSGDTPLLFHDARADFFRLYGLLYDEERGRFLRMPQAVADTVNPGVAALNSAVAGGRLHLRTDSDNICLRADYGEVGRMPHMPLTGQAGFDLYVREGESWVYQKTFIPSNNVQNSMESLHTVRGAGMRDVMIDFPLYNGLRRLEIGLDPEAVCEPPIGYRFEKPVLYYGSSITQGGCASRPGNAYCAMLTRMLDCDHINLGFSGNARGELSMAEYIASLPLSVFVMDYDHNSSPDELAERHEPFFRRVRERCPTLPILLVSAPVFGSNPTWDRRAETIRKTYEKAKARGDRYVWFADGRRFRDVIDCDGTVDGCHPSDLGFFAMARTIAPVLQAALEGKSNEE